MNEKEKENFSRNWRRDRQNYSTHFCAGKKWMPIWSTHWIEYVYSRRYTSFAYDPKSINTERIAVEFFGLQYCSDICISPYGTFLWYFTSLLRAKIDQQIINSICKYSCSRLITTSPIDFHQISSAYNFASATSITLIRRLICNTFSNFLWTNMSHVWFSHYNLTHLFFFCNVFP